MINPHNIPDAWKKILALVQIKFPHAIMAGGCLRDIDYDRLDKVKDVDIFVPASDFKTDAFHYSMQALFGTDVVSDNSGLKEYTEGYDLQEAEGRSIFGLYRVPVDGYNFEIIFGSDQTATIEDFDLSICQIGFDGIKVFTTQEYDDTKQSNVIRLVNARPAHRNGERVARIKDKFPSMEVIVPEEGLSVLGL